MTRRNENKRAAKKARGFIDPDTWEDIINTYYGMCAYCGEREAQQQDHVIPLAKDGQHEADNVVPACAKCNYAKGTNVWAPRFRHRFMSEEVFHCILDRAVR